MTWLIDAEQAEKVLSEYYHLKTETQHKALREALNVVPYTDAEPVKHGKWRFVNCATGLRCQCSECLHWVDAGTDKNYCPNCGARMDEDD